MEEVSFWTQRRLVWWWCLGYPSTVALAIGVGVDHDLYGAGHIGVGIAVTVVLVVSAIAAFVAHVPE